LFWLCVWLVSGAVSLAVTVVHQHQLRREAWTEVVGQPRSGFRFDVNVRNQVQEKTAEKVLAVAPYDWRPLLSYRANLSRIGDGLLGTNAAVERLSSLQPEGFRKTFSQVTMGSQYPWIWSALVLAVYFGLSACILNFSIKSLDRLK
jgi:hypothetical protein